MSMKTLGHGVARTCCEAGAFLGLLLAVACSSDSNSIQDPGPVSGIDPTTMLNMLTPAQAATLCQWTAGRMGGYSRTISCGQESWSSQSNLGCQAAGMTIYACTGTVGTVEGCVNALVGPGPCTQLPVPCVNLVYECMPM
jgi:hypothetical protein